MSRGTRLIVRALAFVLCLAPLGLAAQRPTMHVLSVGIEDYRDRELRQRGAEADARAVVDSLTALVGPMYAIQVTTLLGDAATRDAFVAALDAVKSRVRAEDIVVLYYRGLGSARFLVMADSVPLPPPPSAPGQAPSASLERRLLRPDVLGRWMAALPTRQQLIVLDSPDGPGFFQQLREHIATPAGSLRAPRDLMVLAAPGVPVSVTDAAGRAHSALGAGFLAALGTERRDAPIRLSSAVALRVLQSLDDPVMVYEAGSDLVLGASAQSLAQANAAALRDSTPWSAECGAICPTIAVTGIQQVVTLVGSITGAPEGVRMFVNGRRVRFDASRFEVELPPAAMRAPMRIRVLLPDGTRYETTRTLANQP